MRWAVSVTMEDYVEAIIYVEADSEEEAVKLGRQVDHADVTIIGHQGVEVNHAFLAEQPISTRTFDTHNGCECDLCCPPCDVVGCHDYDITKRTVPLHDGLGAVVMLCKLHGRYYRGYQHQ